MIFKVVQAMTPEGINAMPDISSYLDFVMMIFIAFGFGFEMPIATILLITTGITTAETLKRQRPYVVVGAFFLGMLLTPPDVVSQIMLAIPMWLLFELGLYLSRFFKAEVKAAGVAREEMERLNQEKREALAAASSSVIPSASSADNDEWEDEEYIYSEDDGMNLDDDDFTPLTEEEMEAELDRIEAEDDAENDQGDTSKKP